MFSLLDEFSEVFELVNSFIASFGVPRIAWLYSRCLKRLLEGEKVCYKAKKKKKRIEINRKLIESNTHELPKEFFNSNYDPSWIYEQLLIENLLQYIEEVKFMNFLISVLHRIIQKYLRYNTCSRKILTLFSNILIVIKPKPQFC